MILAIMLGMNIVKKMNFAEIVLVITYNSPTSNL